MKQWYLNTKTGEIDFYNISGGLTDFARGTFLVYGDYLVTGFNTKQQAEEAKNKYFPCTKCKSARPVKEETNNCLYCGEKLK